MSSIYHEITPLTQNDCFTFFSRVKTEFNFPLHYHEDYELNFIYNAAGAKRIVGDNVETIEDYELVLVGSNLPHGWFTDKCKSTEIMEITIQFHWDLLDEKFLRRNQLNFIRTLLDRAGKGVAFSTETIKAFKPRLEALTKKRGFDSVIELISILHDLSISRNMRTLSNSSFSSHQSNYYSRRIEKVQEYIQTNFDKDVTLADVSKLVNMPEVSFCRFFKKRTGKTFVDNLNEVRLGYASRMLIETTLTIAEISLKCGFNNLSYFNRIFKRKNGCTPKEFRHNYSGSRIFI
jgi:AraC-like DNA-binding protein